MSNPLANWRSHCASLLCLACSSTALAETQNPNIIYILSDDLGYGDVGAYGQKEILTPNLDRMAEQGLRFTQHYSGGPVCGPSRATLMTGMSQAVGFIKGNPDGKWYKENFRPQDITIAEKLKEAGYTTACFGKWGLGPQGRSGYPTNQGFDHFIGYDTHIAAHNYYPKKLCQDDGKLALKKGTYSHDLFSEKAIEYISEEHDKPFFLYLAYTIPHNPYNPPDVKPYQNKNWPDKYKKYAAMITRMDGDIGRILDLLAKKNLDDNTLVIFASDNGPQSSWGKGRDAMTKFFNSNGPVRGIKRDVYDGGVRIPMIAWWPGKIAPGESDHISGFQDIMPTFCELVNIQPPAGIDGISMLPTLLGQPEKQKQHETMYWEFVRVVRGKSAGARQGLLLVKDNIKAIRFGEDYPMELYDLDSDIGESKDLSKSNPELTQKLEAYMHSVRSKSEYWPASLLKKGWRPDLQKK